MSHSSLGGSFKNHPNIVVVLDGPLPRLWCCAAQVDMGRRQVEEILDLKCPRCHAVFATFDNCMALVCGRAGCGAAFCAWCQKDCGDDAHRHVQTCPEKPAGLPDLFYAEYDEWMAVQHQRQAKLLVAHLGAIEEPLRPVPPSPSPRQFPGTCFGGSSKIGALNGGCSTRLLCKAHAAAV